MINNIFNLISRFIEIDINLIKTKIPLFQWIVYVISVNTQIIINVFTKKYVYHYLGRKIQSDKLLTIKTFTASIFDIYSETNGLTIFKNSKPVIIDVGANIGQFTTSIKYLMPDAQIYSFEPNPETFKLLKQNTSDLPEVTIYNIGLGDKSEELKFYVNEESSEWSSFVKPTTGKYYERQIEVSTGDKILSNVSDIDLLKIDVEGFEFMVLNGMKDTLKKVNYLLIECSINRESDDLGSKHLINLLHSFGFRIFRIGRIYTSGEFDKQGAVDITFINECLDSSKE